MNRVLDFLDGWLGRFVILFAAYGMIYAGLDMVWWREVLVGMGLVLLGLWAQMSAWDAVNSHREISHRNGWERFL